MAACCRMSVVQYVRVIGRQRSSSYGPTAPTTSCASVDKLDVDVVQRVSWLKRRWSTSKRVGLVATCMEVGLLKWCTHCYHRHGFTLVVVIIILSLLVSSINASSSSLPQQRAKSRDQDCKMMENSSQGNTDKLPLEARLIEAPNTGYSSNPGDDNTYRLDISSGQASIDLGPLVVNEDGTLARITNWEKMSENERKTTLRVLTKRNAQRLAALKAKEGESIQLEQAAFSNDQAAMSDTNTSANDAPVKHAEL